MRRLSVLLIALAGCQSATSVSSDEFVLFFPTAGYQRDDGQWVLPIQAWVYEQTLLSQRPDLLLDWLDMEGLLEDEKQRQLLRARANLFLVDRETGERVSIHVGDRNQYWELPLTGEDGFTNTELTLPSAVVDELAQTNHIDQRYVAYQAMTRNGDDRIFDGRVYLFDARGLMVISDIDDTIRIANANNTKLLIKHMLLEDFEPVDGMSELYRQWNAELNASFYYLSASPCQLLDATISFMREHDFPAGPMRLKTPNPEDGTVEKVLALLSSSPEYKIGEMTRLIEAFPQRTFILVGDTGQHDPEAYGQVMRGFPDQILLTLLRDVTCCQPRDSERYQQAFRDVPADQWHLFREPGEIRQIVLDAVGNVRGKQQ